MDIKNALEKTRAKGQPINRTVHTSNNISQTGKNSSGIDDIRKNYESAKSVSGNKKTIHLGDEKIKCHYKLVEADTPTASHDENTYKPTEGFPQTKGSTANDRNYQTDKDAQESVRHIAANYNGLAISDCPIVTKDGIVLSGNNRTMSSKLAAKNGTDGAYMDALKEECEEYGFDEDDLKQFKHPRLILEMDEYNGNYSTNDFAKFNKDGKKTMNNTEKAVKISKTIDEKAITDIAETMSEYETLGELYDNKKAAMNLATTLVTSGIIDRNELAQYYTEDNGFSETGKDFIETALVGSVLTEDNIRGVSGAGGKEIRKKLVRAILPLIENKGTGNEYSFNKELNEAVKIAVEVSKNHDKFKNTDEYFAQGDLFGGNKKDPLTKKLAEIIHDSTQKDFNEKMKSINAGLRPAASGQFDMFCGGCESKESIMSRILDIKDTVKKAFNSIFGGK